MPPGGLDPAAVPALSIDHLAALKLLTNGSVPFDCAVCLSPFDDGETLRFIPKCQHAFHPGCLDPWLEAQPAPDLTGPQPAPESTMTYDIVIAVDSAEIEHEPSSGGGGFTLGTSPKVLWVRRVLSGAFPLARRQWCTLCGAGGVSLEHLFFRCPVEA